MTTLPPAGMGQFVRFILVGCLNTGFSYGVYALCLWLGLHYAAANFIAMCCGTVFGFVTQSRLVFDNRDPRRFGRFLVAWVVIWGFNVTVIHLFVRWSRFDPYLAGLLALLPVALLSFLIQKHLVFAGGSSSPRPR